MPILTRFIAISLAFHLGACSVSPEPKKAQSVDSGVRAKANVSRASGQMAMLVVNSTDQPIFINNPLDVGSDGIFNSERLTFIPGEYVGRSLHEDMRQDILEPNSQKMFKADLKKSYKFLDWSKLRGSSPSFTLSFGMLGSRHHGDGVKQTSVEVSFD